MSPEAIQASDTVHHLLKESLSHELDQSTACKLERPAGAVRINQFEQLATDE
jgi:hypothetical protein